MTRLDPGAVLLEWATSYDAYHRLAGGPDQLGAVLDGARSHFLRTRDVPDWCGVDLLRGWLFYLARQDHFEGHGHLVERGTDANAELFAVIVALRAHPATTPQDLPPGLTSPVWGGPSMPTELPELDLPSEVAEGVGPYYVYALRDPRDGAVFYVGKGTGSRIVSHIAQVKATGDDASLDSAKVSKIRSILGDGLEVEHLFLRVGIGTEAEAYMVEQAVLDGYAANKLNLSNIAAGHHSDSHGLASLADAIARLGAAPAPALPSGSVIFLINRKWARGMSASDVYEVTHGHWVIGRHSRSSACVGFGVAHGIIRGAYTIEDWRPATSPGNEKRWDFDGKPWSNASEYVGRHVRHLINSSGPGSQNPVRLFLNGG